MRVLFLTLFLTVYSSVFSQIDAFHEDIIKCLSIISEEEDHLLNLRKHLENNLKKITDIKIHGENSSRLPNISNIYFSDIPLKPLCIALIFYQEYSADACPVNL